MIDVCPKGANNPGTRNGCYDASGYVCQCATGLMFKIWMKDSL